MTFTEAAAIVKEYANKHTEGDILWALGELRELINEDSYEIGFREAIAYRVFVTEGAKFFAKDEV